jgi:hypothetical protein
MPAKLRCFVAMAFGQKDTDAIFRALRKTLGPLGVNAQRVDRIEHNDNIDTRTISEIEAADLVTADLTYARPSVYAPTTRFTNNGGSRMQGLFPEAYAGFAKPILDSFAQVTTVTKESDVAEAVYRAANDASGQLRFPAGPDAVALADNARRQFV